MNSNPRLKQFREDYHPKSYQLTCQVHLNSQFRTLIELDHDRDKLRTDSSSDCPKLFTLHNDLFNIKLLVGENSLHILPEVKPVDIVLSIFVGGLLIAEGVTGNELKDVHLKYNLNFLFIRAHDYKVE